MTPPLEHGAVTVTVAAGDRRTYRIDPRRHRIVVTDAASERVRFTFGRRGSGLGSFDVPIDLTLVAPQFHGEPLTPGPDTCWIAVADYGNARVQIFDLDGALVDVLNGEDLDYGWRPCRLTWRAPFLQIDGAERGGCRVHLAAAMLAHRGDRIGARAAGAAPAGGVEGRH